MNGVGMGGVISDARIQSTSVRDKGLVRTTSQLN